MDTNLYEKRTNVQNQLTNTFVKGMDTDTSDMLLGSDKYRYAENVRVVTNTENNTGELHLVEGTVERELLTNKQILATNYVRDIAIYIAKDKDRRNTTENEDPVYTPGPWYVYKKIGNNSSLRVFGPCTEPIWNVKEDRTTPDTIDDIKKSITTVVRYEAPLNIKLYIADSTGKHSIMVLNIANQYEWDGDNENKFNLVFAYQRTLLPPAEVEIGVGSGSIVSGKVQYVYRLYSKNGAATPLSILSKTLSLYKNEYSGYEAEKRSGRSVSISIDVLNRNNLDYILIYRISYQLSGELPKISLIKDEKITSSYVDIGTDIEENIGISEFLSMFTPFIYPKQIESKGDYLFAANMKYSQDDVDELFEYFDATSYSKGNYTEDYLQVVEVVNGNLTIHDIGEDTLLHHAFILGETPVYNPDHWNYYVLDYETVTVADDEEVDLTISKINNCFENNNPIRVQIQDYSSSIHYGLVIYFTYLRLYNGDVNATTLAPNYRFSLHEDSDILPMLKMIYNDISAEDGYIEDSLVFNRVTIENDNINHQPTFTITVLYNFCNGYGKNICWRYIYDDLPELSVLNQTGKSDKLNTKFTFRSGETYRFGVKLYNQYGQASSVKWIADIMIPDHANMYDDNGTTKFRNVGIEFLKTPGSESLWTGISGWEIVRCERTLSDRKAITLGIIGLPYKCYTYTTDNTPHTKQEFLSASLSATDTHLMCNPGFFSTDFSSVYHQSTDGSIYMYTICIPSTKALMFSSPEICYQGDDIDNILKTNNIYILTVYNTYSNTITEQYENVNENTPGTRIFLNQSENSSMSFCFFWPNDHYSFIRNRDFEFILNYNNLWASGRGFQKTYEDNSKTRYYFNYFTPNYSDFTYPNTNIKINNISTIDSPDYSDFAKDGLFTYKNNTTSLQDDLFINWSVPLLLDVLGYYETTLKDLIDNINPRAPYAIGGDGGVQQFYTGKRACYPVGTGGKLILLSVDNFNTTVGNSNKVPSITIANIYKDTVPYGGYNDTTISNSSYISFGDYCDSSNDSIQVYSGDTKNSIFTYNALHIWHDTTYKNCVKMATVYAVPIETDIDIQAQYGLLYGVDTFYNYNIQDKPSAFDNYTQTKNSYLYNPAYNATPDIVSWTTPEALESKIDYFDTRVHYSNVKINNENIDNWILFLASNYIDVDSRYGEITDLKLFKDKLIFWLENATGLLAVNERVVLNDLNDTQVVLGTGGVLERYDYFTTVYGLKKNQHVRALSNDSLYWWDENNKEILLYQNKYEVIPLSTVKGITNYINNNSVSTIPFATYDNKYKEVLLNVVNNETVVYNENIQAFTSVYKFNPLFDFIVSGKILLTSNNTIYEYNCQNVDNGVNKSVLFSTQTHPLIQYVVNTQPMYNKVFDIQTIGGRFYGGGYDDDLHERNNQALQSINLIYKTPLKQEARSVGTDMTNVEYDYRITVPRAGYETTENKLTVWKVNNYGDRLRGKTMRCEINSSSNNPDFSLQYITTKFRMSWS